MFTGRKCPLFMRHFDLVDIYVSIHVHQNVALAKGIQTTDFPASLFLTLPGARRILKIAA